MIHRRSRRTFAAVLGAVLLLPLVILIAPKPTPASTLQEDAAPAFEVDDWPMTTSAARGKEVYQKYCVGCHGTDGRGQGDAARFLRPLPRNFVAGNFKFRSTPTGKLPTEDDLMRTITCGLPGSSMPGFPLVPEVERKNVARYVLHLATFKYGRRDVEKLMKRGKSLDEILADDVERIRDEVWTKRVTNAKTIPIPPSPKVTPALLAAGKTKYLGECNRCHGDSGLGDGPSSYSLRDWKDDEILARDFTTGVFRAGSAPEDLYRRLKTGLNGTPMPSIPGTDEEMWGLVHYMLSLVDPDAKPARLPAGCADGEGR